MVFDYQGGFTPPRTSNDATMTIRADGTVILGAPFGQLKRIETKIPSQKVQEILHRLLDEFHLDKFDEAKVKRAVARVQMQRGGIAPRIADAPTTIVRIHADGKRSTAQYYAVGMVARQYPTVKELTHLEAARKYLEQVRAEVYLGGPKGVARYVKIANAELAKSTTKAPPLKAADLQSASVFADGRTTVSFQREEKLAPTRRRITSVIINVPQPDAAPQVRVFVRVLENGRPAKPGGGRV